MKTLFIFLSFFISSALFAQTGLPQAHLPANRTLHFISPEPIQYVDISSKAVAGDLPLKNVLRIRLKDTSSAFGGALITIAGEKFIVQYQLTGGGAPGDPALINISPENMQPLDISGIGFSQNQLKAIALNLICRKAGRQRERAAAYDIRAVLNHVYALGDYIFLDISYHNSTSLVYDISALRFSIEDKKINKAENSQSLELFPVFTLLDKPSFVTTYRNIFAFKKMSFPGNKVLAVELSEKQISGRILRLNIAYQDILDADVPAY